MIIGDVCHEMADGEVLNAHLSHLPLHKCTIYGDRVLSAKLSKRVSCAIKHLQIRLQFDFNSNIDDAINIGVRKDPTVVLDGKIFIEGLTQAEEITKQFEQYLKDESANKINR